MATAASTLLTIPVTDRDHVRGSAGAMITLLEYGNYSCPRCNQARSVVRQLQAALRDRLRYAFRNFPTPTLHPKAYRAAQAAEAAGAQNKFWQMHDLLYDRQTALSDKHLRVYGTQVGLDMERFTRDMMLQTFALRVLEDTLSACQGGVSTTPTFFINGERYLGPCDYQTMLFHIEEASRGERTCSHPLRLALPQPYTSTGGTAKGAGYDH